MSKNMHISVVLGRIADLEAKSADLYSFYAEIFEDSEVAARIFLEMKREEEGHLNQVLFQKRIVDKNPSMYPEMMMDLTPINRLIDLIENHIQNGVFSVLEALDFAIELEQNAAEVHYRSFTEKRCAPLRKLTQFLKNSDKDHIGKLFALRSLIASQRSSE